jgi:hypothetical protein
MGLRWASRGKILGGGLRGGAHPQYWTISPGDQGIGADWIHFPCRPLGRACSLKTGNRRNESANIRACSR